MTVNHEQVLLFFKRPSKDLIAELTPMLKISSALKNTGYKKLIRDYLEALTSYLTSDSSEHLEKLESAQSQIWYRAELILSMPVRRYSDLLLADIEKHAFY